LDLTDIAIARFLTYILVVFRVGGIMIFAPFFGSGMISAQLKVALTMILALALLPVASPVLPGEITTGYILVTAAGESAVGLFIGYAASLIFVGVQLAGMQIGQQMGTGIATVFNPLIESQTSLISQFYYLFALFIYLGIGGHHLLLAALVRSFEAVPAGWTVLSGHGLNTLITYFGHLFTIAFVVSAPVVLTLFLTTVALGFVARTVPQMNILIIGFPIRVVVAITVMIFTLPAIGRFTGRTILVLMEGLAGAIAQLG
jgi:flagellar biosynthetic protein FliR